ncbi:hypothetical protein [Flavobacterium sp. HSC-61S13]|uniref:hypothetical protein n=1 Tax=Flavobacterium sp. HSC-61S13 TaxID=2910963 RepID=UPI0020A0F9CD|nr:hypothetical protein [Flavobacterium sp. HSC-61S13]MCP1996483.1 hypothetical protein [Flavobacterium sp. HSC-61S13]
MKNIFIFLSLWFVLSVKAQTGINERAPKASLHINKQNTADEIVGVLFPILPASELATTTDSEHDGVMVYVNEIDIIPVGVLREVTRRGYYYFDKSKQAWTAIGRRYINIIEEDKLIYAQVYRQGFFNLNSSGGINFANNYLTWNGINGTPQSSSLKISSDNRTVIFPKGHLFRVTAMICITNASKPGNVTSRFETTNSSGTGLLLSTMGYIETINEPYAGGGVAYAMAVVNTHENEVGIRLNTKFQSSSSGSATISIAGSETNDSFYYSHLIVEEL